jgi:anti-sigma-K factor RskA
MRYRDKPELQDRLAAEYVLGTLRGRARLRFEEWAREDAALRQRVEGWQARLAPLAETVAPVRPSRRVWKAIETRIGAEAGVPRRDVAPAPAVTGWSRFWESVAFWRATGLIATGMAAALLVSVVVQKPQVVEVPVAPVVNAGTQKMQPSYVAVLRDDAGKIVFLAYAARESNELWFRRVAMGDPKDNMGYELWGLPMVPGEKPRSLGMIPGGETGTIPLRTVANKALEGYPVLAITMEPSKGSGGAATGPMVAKGDCQKFW